MPAVARALREQDGHGDGPPAVVLLSGGLDSATCLAIARREGFRCHALSVRYGQRHAAELDAAAAVARQLGAAEHLVLEVDLGLIGGSALTDDIPVPTRDRVEDVAADTEIPATYVPARNTVLLSLALAVAEVRGARDIFIGVNAVDYSGYPDCRPDFIGAFEAVARLATRAGVTDHAEGRRELRVHAPLIDLAKAEIIRLGTRLGVDYGSTISCYDPRPGPVACGRCDACLLRRKGFADAGAPDPVPYDDGN